MVAAVVKKSIRHQIIEALGGQCAWPGGCDVTDPDILQIDHVLGGGTQERRRFGYAGADGLRVGQHISRVSSSGANHHYYEHILNNVTSGDYQLLCANHNIKKHAIDRRCKKWEGEPPCPFAA